MKLNCLILLIFNILSFTFPQVQSPESFFPSASGDIWKFNTDHGLVKREIVKDSIGADSSKYLFLALNTAPIYKIDSKLNVYWFDFEKYKIYKLDADSGETWISDTRFNIIARVDDIFQSYIFGKLRYVKDIGYYRPAPGDTTITDNAAFESDTWLVSGIGEYYEFRAEEGPTMQLLGCIIDGDTLGTITSVNEKYYGTPNEFKLFQNYPNPFNPNTTIEFDITTYAKVCIKIYNILGKYISTIVNEYKNAGNYKVLFKAKELPSGIYFYTINVNGKTNTKSMVLLK